LHDWVGAMVERKASTATMLELGESQPLVAPTSGPGVTAVASPLPPT
jgi:hypothetical protein